MANEPGNFKKYGIPIYGADWVPKNVLRSAGEPPADDEKDDGDKAPDVDYIVLAGGGGEGSSGIHNALLIVQFDFDSSSLSDEPVTREETGDHLPYRMAVHPGGEGLICAMQNSCRWFDWEFQGADNRSLGLTSSERVLESLQDGGQQLALAFNSEGSLLAVGGEDGRLRVYKWPSMGIILDQAKAHASVKDLHFSPDGKFLASAGSGPCRIWEVSTSTSVAALTKNNDEIFGFCRFSPINDETQVLYVTTMRDQGVSISKWSTSTWEKISSKRVVRDPICSFDVSPNGKLLAVGTIEGNILIVSSNNLGVQNVIRKAHLGLVTSLKFSEDSRGLLSASLDASARVTIMKEKNSGLSLWIIILVLLIAIAVFYAASNGRELNSLLKR